MSNLLTKETLTTQTLVPGYTMAQWNPPVTKVTYPPNTWVNTGTTPITVDTAQYLAEQQRVNSLIALRHAGNFTTRQWESTDFNSLGIYFGGGVSTGYWVTNPPITTTIPGYYSYYNIPTTYVTSYDSNLGWNSSARSIPSILGDGVGKFSPRIDVVGAVVGLTTIPASADPSYNGIAYGIYFASGLYRVLENGLAKTGNLQYAAGDIFSVVRTSGIITYAKNGIIFYQSSTPTVAELVMDSSLYSAGDIIMDASLVDGSSMDMASAIIATTSTLYGLPQPKADILTQSTIGFSGRYTTSNDVHVRAAIITGATIKANKDFGGYPAITATATLAATYYVATGITASFNPLVAFATSGYPTYAGISASLSSLTAFAGTGQIVPASSGIAASFVSMGAVAHCLTGENTLSNTANLKPMVALGTSRYHAQSVFAYAAISASFSPMLGILGDLPYANSYAIITAPSLSLSAAGHETFDGAYLGFVDSSISALGGWNATGGFDTPTLSSTGTLTETISATLPFITTTLDSFVNVAANAAASLTFIESTILGLAGANAALLAPSFAFTGFGTDTYGERGLGSLGFIFTDISATGSIDERGSMTGGFLDTFLSYSSAALTGPVFSLDFYEDDVNTEHKVAYIFNTTTQEMTTYSNYPFMNIIQINRKPYGVKADGLYLLEGTTDLTIPINGSVTTKDSDFGFFNSKNIEQVYLNSDTLTTLTPIVDGVTAPVYPSSFKGRRVAIARGLAGRYWQFKIDGIQQLEGLEATCILRQRSVK